MRNTRRGRTAINAGPEFHGDVKSNPRKRRVRDRRLALLALAQSFVNQKARAPPQTPCHLPKGPSTRGLYETLKCIPRFYSPP